MGPGISYERLKGPINPDSRDEKKPPVDRNLTGRNPNVAYVADHWLQRPAGTAGHAVDPISNTPFVKGEPKEPLSMSKGAQFGRRLGLALEPGFERRVAKQKLAGPKKAKKKGKM